MHCNTGRQGAVLLSMRFEQTNARLELAAIVLRNLGSAAT